MIKFNVIEGQGKVTARLDGCSMDAYNILVKKLPSCVTLDKNAVLMKSTYKAHSTCHPNDEFSVDTGKALAKERVIAKYNRDMSRILAKFETDLAIYEDYLDARLDYFEAED